jgi:membrane protein
MSKFSIWILKWLRIFWRAAKHFYNEDYTYHCSALAFITILAIVPVFSVMVYLFGIFHDFSDVFTTLNNYIYANFLPTSVQLIHKYIDQFTKQASRLPAISVVFSFVTGVMLLLVIEQTLNQIWRVHNKKRHLVTRLIAFTILLLLPLFVGFSSLLSEYIYTKIEINFIQYLTINILNLIINTSIFAIFYIVVPNKMIAWKEGIVGGFITAILFEIVKKGFVWYIAYFSNYTIVYGALAAFPIFLTWLYVSWVIFLYGALCMQVKAGIEHR